MGFSIQYRSTDTMHPARAYEIKQHAEQLIKQYTWLSCEPVLLEQNSDGVLAGNSKPNFFPAELDPESASLEGLPDGTIVTLAEVLCVLSRDHGVNWEIGHDYEPEPIGWIQEGVADADLIDQLETFGSIGDLLDDLASEEEDAAEAEAVPKGSRRNTNGEKEQDDEEPRLLKFPGTQ